MKTPKLEVKRGGASNGKVVPSIKMQDTEVLISIDRKLGELISLFREAFIDDRMVGE